MSKKAPVTGRTRARKPRVAKVFRATAKARAQVQAYASVGIAQEHIASLMGVSEDTLVKHFTRELATAANAANAVVAQQLFRHAANTDDKGRPGKGTTAANVQVQAAVAWLKMRAGWRDRSDEAPRVNVTGTNVTVDASVKVLQANVKALDDATLTTLNEALARLLPSAETKS